MTLREVILSAASLPEEAMIYTNAEKNFWNPGTLCQLIEEEEDDVVIYREGQPLFYFLESSTLLEVIEGWQEISRGNEATENDIVRVVIYYARYDSWPQPVQ